MAKYKEILKQLSSKANNNKKNTTNNKKKNYLEVHRQLTSGSKEEQFHKPLAIAGANKNGGMKSVSKSNEGTQYNYKNGKGYWVGK